MLALHFQVRCVRNPASVTLPGVVPVRLDVTDPSSIAAAVSFAPDVNLLINNAGSWTGASLLTGELPDIRLEMDTHFFGTLAVTRAFAPRLAGLLNVLSVRSWVTSAQSGAYSAAKSAEWSLTNALRLELPATQVTALHVGYLDTDMAAHVDGPKNDPAKIAALALDGFEAGAIEVVADELSRTVKGSLSGPVTGLYPSVA
ncbi:MAG TPA: SDR family NAD(P)-dependent oxidoreductase [Actinophytocola sp.]|jgi:NAD(P)-dependent dehydrogenase (short-subunit alcohol dehydrogenase family)|nr:SDR family NAD(P)-dependent oxidoreductase [Actinophytocola sp.]